MIDFKDKDRMIPSALILFAIVILAGCALYSVIVPMPTATGSSHSMVRRRIMDEIADARRSGQTARMATKPLLWQGDPDSVSAGVLALLTEQASKRSLKIEAFRPQPSVDLGVMSELPYVLQISGPDPSLRSLMDSLDARGSKIVLRSAQIGSSEQASNSVAATLGISAYLASDAQLAANFAASLAAGAKSQTKTLRETQSATMIDKEAPHG